MTTIATETVRIAASPVITLKGRGKQAREMAYMRIAPLSFIENISRVESIANLHAALGAHPSEAEVKTAQSEWIIGRVASRLPAGEFPRGTKDDSDKLEFARDLVLHYAAPPQAGKQARALRTGQKGRRNVVQQRVVRAAEEAWSLVKAEIGLGKAMTQKQRNDSKRSTNANPKRGDGKGKVKPNHAELVTPNIVSSDDYVQHMQTQLAALVAFDKKYATKRPTTHGAFAEALLALKQLANKAANDYEVRKAAAIAKASKPK